MTKIYLTQTGFFTARHGHGGALAEASHEHTFRYEITFHGTLNAEGYLIDFRDLSAAFKKEIDARFEGKDLCTFFENPTTEALCIWIYRRINDLFPHLYSVKVAEAEDRWTEYRGEE